MNRTEEMDARIEEMRGASETLRMDIQRAQEATARLRQAHKDIKQLLDTEVPRIVAEAVAFHINRSNVESRRNR